MADLPRAQRDPRDDQQEQAQAQEGPPPFWEWCVAAIGLGLVVACLAYLTVHALRGPPAPPDPVLEVVAVHEQGRRFLLVLRVVNRGAATAQDLKIAGELKQAGTVLERSETEFQFLPGQSWREGGLFFANDPRKFQLELVPVSYQKP